jgi:UDP-N-acetylmuramoyl-tripeptide--D-alanyl-D-alanine ligase
VLTLADVLEALTGIRPAGATVVIAEGAIDSRLVIPGALFIALPGEHTDGHYFVEAAFQRGASVALIQNEVGSGLRTLDLRSISGEPDHQQDELERCLASLEPPFCLRVENSLQALQQIARFWRSRQEVEVIGITGSVGKSTTKELVAEVLGQRYGTLKNKGNLNNEIGLPLTLLNLGPGHERAVLEMGFYVPGEIAFLCNIAKPRIGVITNIGTVHAERAGDQETIARGKAELVQSLPADGVAILNYDDPLVREMATLTAARIFYYGMDPSAELWADNVEGLGLEGIRFRLHYHGEVLYLRVPLIGRHSVQTALRAAAVGLADGLTWQDIVNGLHSASVQLRLIVVRTESGALLLDDTYNASPESMLAALNLLDEMDGRKIAVLGDMLELGQYEWRGHELVGIRASEVVKELVTLGERGRMIAAAACRAGLPAGNITELETVDQVIELLRKRLTAQDVVLIKGSRGMRMDRIVAALEVRS